METPRDLPIRTHYIPGTITRVVAMNKNKQTLIKIVGMIVIILQQ